MDSPQNHIWGPELWTILHSSAERFGQPSKRLPDDEKRIWFGLLRSLQFSLPCPLCKKHYISYFHTNQILLTREGVRSWLFNLHNQVNQRNNKPNEMTLEKLTEQYGKPFRFSQHYRIVVKQMMMALRLGWSTREDIQRTIRFFEELMRYYDFV